MMRALVFLDDAYTARWLLIDADSVVARGMDLATIPPIAPEDGEIVAIVSGLSVAIHWVNLPPLATAQAAAAAQLLAADVCAGAIDTAHVALGVPGVEGTRPLAIVENAVMRDWLATLAAAGLDAARLIPLPILVPQAASDAESSASPASVLAVGDIGHVRGERQAFSAELALVDIILAGAMAMPVTVEQFEASLPAMLATHPLDLLQGEFARAKASPLDRRRFRRIGVMAMAAAALWLGTEMTALLRDNLAADRIERQAADAARAALPRGTAIDAPRAQVTARANGLGGPGQGFTALAAPLLVAMQAQPNLLLQSLQYAPDSGLAAVVVVPKPADRENLARGLAGQGRAITMGNPRENDGATVVDVMVRPQ